MNGKIFLYRVFDIGPDVNPEKVQNRFMSDVSAQRFKLAKSSRAMIINNAPLALTLEGGKFESLGLKLDYEVSAKIWHFGALSINIQMNIPSDLSWQKLIELGSFLENDKGMHDIAVQKTKQILASMDPVRSRVIDWETYEDYILYFFKSLPGTEVNAWAVFQNYDVYRLILSEQTEVLSEQVKKTIADGALQYGQNDLAVINWNSALIIEPSGLPDIPDVIEFSLCQLLEMRYYDDLLDTKLADLYNELGTKKRGVWETYAERLSREAAQRYLEISETVESVENSLKVVGDFYLAQIFRTASSRFRFNDWRDSVDQKLNNLAQISKILTSEVNERRNHILEIIIIILIAIEVVPYLGKLLF
ncbi:MAG: hypothetical protein KF802_10755 [Bdellovibrionaceae bacterium]|nr:hypothetical protein [Pseudobdellovibrionaceae bacterium]MBX3034608.1 hypothetical protein [Pseudobdellovibrionaceae bacterium]